MRFSVCIDKVFFMQDFIEGMRTTKAAGVDTYEFWKWWEKDVDAILKAQEELGMRCATFCTKFVSLLEPSLREEYMQGVRETLEVGKRFGVNLFITQVGYAFGGGDRDKKLQSIVDGLKACVPMLEDAGATLIVEPINTIDQPGYFLSRAAESFGIVEAVGSEHIKILYDIYHFQMTEGNLISTIRKNIDKIGHLHAAGCPGRNEITKGEIDYPEVFRAVRDTGYTGFVGLECVPDGDRGEAIRGARDLFNTSLKK